MQTPCNSSPVSRETTPGAPANSGRPLYHVSVIVVPAIVLLTACLIGPYLDLRQLAAHEAQIRQFCSQHAFAALAFAFAIYTIAAGLSLPAATALTLACGWIFGFWPALILVSFASTAGASLAFLASRLLFQSYITSSHSQKLQAVRQAIDQDGVHYLLMLRLVPLMPFFLVNLLMGLTRMRLRTFWWSSQLGMLPATAVYVAAGAATPSLDVFVERGFAGLLSPQLVAALAVAGLMPISIRLIGKRFRNEFASYQVPAGSCSDRTR